MKVFRRNKKNKQSEVEENKEPLLPQNGIEIFHNIVPKIQEKSAFEHKKNVKYPTSYLDLMEDNASVRIAPDPEEVPPPANTMTTLQLMRHEKKNFYKPPLPYNKDFDLTENNEGLKNVASKMDQNQIMSNNLEMRQRYQHDIASFLENKNENTFQNSLDLESDLFSCISSKFPRISILDGLSPQFCFYEQTVAISGGKLSKYLIRKNMVLLPNKQLNFQIFEREKIIHKVVVNEGANLSPQWVSTIQNGNKVLYFTLKKGGYHSAINILQFDLITRTETNLFSYTIKITEERHHMKSAIFLEEFNGVSQISRPEDDDSFLQKQIVAIAYGQADSDDIKKIELRALSNFEDIIFFKDIRIRNPTMQILKASKNKHFYPFSQSLNLQEDLIIIYDWDDKMHTLTILEEEGKKSLKDEEYEKMKNQDLKMKVKYNILLNIIKEIYSQRQISCKRVDNQQNRVTLQSFVSKGQKTLRKLLNYRGNQFSVLIDNQSAQVVINSDTKGEQILILSEFFEKYQDFTEMGTTNQLILLPTVDHPKDDLFKKPHMVIIYKYLNDMVAAVGQEGLSVYQKTKEGEIVKYKQNALNRRHQFSVLPITVTSEVVKPDLQIDQNLLEKLEENKSYISLFGLTINNSKNLKNSQLGIFVKDHGLIKYKLCESLDNEPLLWIIHPKILDISDQDPHRVFILLEPQGDDTLNFKRPCKILTLFIIVFDQDSQSVILSQEIRNPFLQEIHVERFNAWQTFFSFEETMDRVLGVRRYTVYIRYDEIKTRQMMEIEVMKDRVNLVGLKMFMLKPRLSIENDRKYITKEQYPMFDDDNKIVGNYLVFKLSEGNLRGIELPNKTIENQMYNKQSRTFSGHTLYEDVGVLFEAELTPLMLHGNKLQINQQYMILFDQIMILMNIIPTDLQDFLEKNYQDEIDLKLEKNCPYQALEGKTIIHDLIDAPEDLRSQLQEKREDMNCYLKTNIERITNQNSQIFKKQSAIFQRNKTRDIDLAMGVDQVSVLQYLLDNNFDTSIPMFCEFIFDQDGLNDERIDILMTCFDSIFKMNFGSLISPLFEKHVPELTSDHEDPMKLEKYLKGMQYKEFLDEELIVVTHYSIQFQQYLPEKLIKEKMMILDNENSHNPAYKVEHYYIDFTRYALRLAIEATKNIHSSVIVNMNHYELSKLLVNIFQQNKERIDEFKGIRNLIDIQFDEFTIWFFSFLFNIYIFTYCVPLLCIVFTDSLWIKITSTVLCALNQLIMLYIERIHFLEIGLHQYVADFWNKIDLVMLCVNFLYLMIKTIELLSGNTTSFSVTVEEGDEQLLKQEQSVIGIGYILITIVVVCFAFFKIMFYLRVYEQFGQLVRLLQVCIYDMKEFSVFLLMWILFFSTFFLISGVAFDDGDYSEVSPFFVNILQTYRNSIGDISPPLYPMWVLYIKSGDPSLVLQGNLMIGIIWVFWVLHQFMIVIILLNFLIAVISQSYEMVMSQQIISTYLHRCDLNLECLRILDYFGVLNPINFFAIASSDSEIGKENSDEWLGFVSEVKKFIEKNNKMLKINQQKKFESLSEEIQSVSNKLQNQVNTIRSSVAASQEDILKEVKEALEKLDAKNTQQMEYMDNRHMDKMDTIQYSIQTMTSLIHMAQHRESEQIKAKKKKNKKDTSRRNSLLSINFDDVDKSVSVENLDRTKKL